MTILMKYVTYIIITNIKEHKRKEREEQKRTMKYKNPNCSIIKGEGSDESKINKGGYLVW